MLPHSSSENLSLIARHPDRHVGELVSTFGQVLKIDADNATTVFQITTPNYVFSFLVSYSGDIPGLMEGQNAYFFGRVTGSKRFESDAYTGVMTLVNAITVDGIAVQPIGGTKSRPFASPTAVYRPEDQKIAEQWLRGDLDLSEAVYREPSPMRPAVASPPLATSSSGASVPVVARPSPAAAPAPAVAAASAAESAPAIASAPSLAPSVFADKPDSKELKKFLKLWKKLSQEDQAKFLERVEQKGGTPPPQ